MGISKNTFVFFTSDNGAALISAPKEGKFCFPSSGPRSLARKPLPDLPEYSTQQQRLGPADSSLAYIRMIFESFEKEEQASVRGTGSARLSLR